MYDSFLSSYDFLRNRLDFKNISRFYNIFNIPDKNESIFKKETKKRTILFFNVKGLEFLISLNNKYNKLSIYSLTDPYYDDMVNYASLPYLGVMLDIPVLHVSGVKKDGKLFLFSGESESGKSTITKYLSETMSAEIVADDFLLLTDNGLETTGFFYKEDERYIKNRCFRKEVFSGDVFYFYFDQQVKKHDKTGIFMYLIDNTYNINFAQEIGMTQKVYSDLSDFINKVNIMSLDYTKDKRGLEEVRRCINELL